MVARMMATWFQSGVSHGDAVRLLQAADAVGVEYDEDVCVATNANCFFSILMQIDNPRFERDPRIGRPAVRYLGIPWFIDRSVPGAGTSRAQYYVKNLRTGEQMSYELDDCALPNY